MGRHATTLLPFSLLVGLVFQDAASLLRPAVPCLAVALTTVTLARTDWPRVLTLLRRPVFAILLSLITLIAVPLLVWPFWQAVGLWPGLVAALCLSAMAPGIISAVTTANFLRLDSSLVLMMTITSNFMVPFTLPPLALWLLGLDLKLSVWDLGSRLALIIGLSLVFALAIRRWRGPRLSADIPALDGMAVVVLAIFTIPLMDGILARALTEPLKLFGFILASFGGMLLCNALMVGVCWPFTDRLTALTAGYSSGGRHNALLMAVLPATVDPDIFLFIAAVQVPLYVIPALLRPFYRRVAPA